MTSRSNPAIPCLLFRRIHRPSSPEVIKSENPITLNLQKCPSSEGLDPIFATMIKTNFLHQDTFFLNQFITTCSNLRHMEYAILAFTANQQPDTYTCNVMIKGFLSCSMPVESLRLFVNMCRCHLLPSCYTFSSLIKACAVARAEEFGFGVHGQILKVGFASQVFVQTAVVDMYAEFGQLVRARKVFDNMTVRDVFAWTTMISVHLRFGDLVSARRLFDNMPERSVPTWNAMISGLGRSGDVNSATSLFAEMPVKDLVSWTSMISCYSQNKLFKEALEVFKQMMTVGIVPDEVTMTTVISACAHLGALHVGEEVHRWVAWDLFNLSVYVGSALIDMYAKCGDLKRSLMVFFKLRRRNLFCWNSVIEGLAVHGHGKEALTMFSLMERDKEIKPNGVTFVSILSACTHSGLIEEGRQMFSDMTKKHKITPQIEHYGCIVDLLGRAGFLQEALDMIKEMKIKPNSVIWGALLNGCKIHKNLNIGQIAASNSAVLEPDDTGYLLLSVNMYAEANQWGRVADVRENMSLRYVQKSSPGHSWIEINGNVHQFMACDDSHPMADDIYQVLIELYCQLKHSDYTPELVSFDEELHKISIVY